MIRDRTEQRRQPAGLPAQLLLVCLLLAGSRSLQAANACFYDGVSQTRLTHIIQQISDRYQTAVITDNTRTDSVWLAQPLGDCSLAEFLDYVIAGSDWHYRLSSAGVVLYFRPQEDGRAVPESTPEEVIVTGVPYLRDPDLAVRYSSNGLMEQAAMAPGQLAGSNDLTASVGRISALTFTQEAGMDRNLSIRGLSSDFTRVLVNGMPMLATSTSIDARGSVNNSRSFDFDVLPQGLFTHVLVSKSVDARGGAGAIGGSVDLRTPLPLPLAQPADSPRQWLSLQAESNTSNGSDGMALAGGLQGISDDGDSGWLLGFSYRDRATEERGFSTVRWQTADWGEQPLLTAEQQALLASGEVFYPRHNRYDLLERQQTTYGLNSALQWHNTGWGDVDLTLFSARTRQEMHEYHISSAGLKTQDLSAVQVNDFAVDDAGMKYGDFSGVDIRSEHNHEMDETRLSQLKLDWYMPFSADIRLHSSLGYQRSVFDSPVHDKVSLMSYDQDFSFDLRPDDRMAVNHYGFDISDPQEWQLYSVTLQDDQVINQYRVASLELEINNSSAVKQYAGVQFQGFFNDRRQAEYDNDSLSGPVGAWYQLTPGHFSSGPGPASLPSHWVVGRQDVIDYLGLTDAELIRDPLQQRRLNEYSWDGWWQTSFEFWQLDWPIRGDAGLRYSATRQFVRGNWQIGDETSAITTRNAYANWLPSLHLVAQARDDLLLRFAYRRDLAQPAIDDLTSPLLLRSSAQLIEGGNTELQPSHAHAFDLAAEWYGTEQQFLALGLFYKRIDSLIVEQVEEVTLDQLPYYNPLWDQQSLPDGIYTYRRPVNGPGTDISGLELSIDLPFYFLPLPFSHLGISAGYALSRGLVRYPLDNGYDTLPPPGLSRHVVNASVWYRSRHFRTGVTLRARSQYLTRVPGANDNDREGVNAAVILGAYASWDVSPQLSLSVDARNLTNEAFDLFVDSSNRVYSYSTTGTEIFAGISLKFGG